MSWIRHEEDRFTQQSESDDTISKEQILVDLMCQGITTLEELLEKTVPEVGGFMAPVPGSGAETFVGDWYVYYIDTTV
mgnify:CR=1 FL=1